jgi:predicted DNA-binding transcriptional regulator AlpA
VTKAATKTKRERLMEKSTYLTIPQLAKILGVSRIAVFKKVKRRDKGDKDTHMPFPKHDFGILERLQRPAKRKLTKLFKDVKDMEKACPAER